MPASGHLTRGYPQQVDKTVPGIGNSTGLGMAPFLILHPQLIDRWLQQREQAWLMRLAEAPSEASVGQLVHAVEQARRYFEETWIENEAQAQRNCMWLRNSGSVWHGSKR